MSDYQDSRAAAPRTPGEDARGGVGHWKTYAVGLGLALLLTGAAFAMAGTTLMTPASIVAGLIVLAIAQMIVHLIFFLHITTAPAHKTNILALLLTFVIILLVVIGSLVIMGQSNGLMMPMDQLMSRQR
ncbi:cytochrome C oxidase subunit IV family protein [Phenylobacterium sp.]|uniref:cytochrome o ubiquinol oxidase subunit IV n=1 Tax=Phenylobacterium sp. TaxID=1871053 RepID=UPI001225700A|nr:cytochrome C oxidase subunit IV family protein [Phenylobacterium sp.]THD63853.1 MAG: cytochrome o ubiquinol oxidase subunit IV [Phenylobacterium sp.]